MFHGMNDIRQETRRRLQQTLEDRSQQQRDRKARYMREVYRPSRKSLNVTLTPEQYERIMAAAAEAGYRPRVYLREITLASLDRRPLVPRGLEAALWASADQLRAAGHNLNQIARLANTRREISPEQLQEARACLGQMEVTLERLVFAPFRSPWS